VWFARDDHQVGWKQYLDDVQNAGYVWTELGPQGFLPQDPQQLRDELDQRGLKVCGGTVFAGLHKGKEALDKAIKEFSQEAKLLSEVGAKFLIHLPEQYTDMHTGEATQSGDIDPEQWANLISGTNELGRIIFEEYGVNLVSHPHADTHLDIGKSLVLRQQRPRQSNQSVGGRNAQHGHGFNVRSERADHLSIVAGRPHRGAKICAKEKIKPETDERDDGQRH